MDLNKEIYTILNNLQIKSLIILSYPGDIYPQKSSEIKIHLKKILTKLNFSKKSLGHHFYFYQLQDDKRICVFLVSTLDYNENFLKLEKIWNNIIGNLNIHNSLCYEPVVEKTIQKLADYLTQIIISKELPNAIIKELGSGSRIFGGSSGMQILLKKLRGHTLEVTPLFRAPIDTKLTLEEIRDALLLQYKQKSISEELLDQQLSYELSAYGEAISAIQLEDIERFLSTSKSETSKGYLKFYNFIRSVVDETSSDFHKRISQWYNTFERKPKIARYIQKYLGINDNKSSNHQKEIYRRTLIILIRNALRGIDLLTTAKELGKISLSAITNDIDIENEELQDYYIRWGYTLFEIISSILRGKIDFERISDRLDENCIQDNFEFSMNHTDHNKEIIFFDFNSKWVMSLSKGDELTKMHIGNLLGPLFPMIVEPKDWQIPDTENTIKQSEMYSAQSVHSGGLLLNGYYIQKPLQKKSSEGHRHKLEISPDVVKTINKIQKVAYTVNKDLHELLIEFKQSLPDYKDAEEIAQILKERKQLKANLTKAFSDRRTLVESKGNITAINKNIRETYNNLKTLEITMSKHLFLERLISSFETLKQINKFYYSYEADFRMRLYPQQYHLSPQASKLTRALLKFHEETEFNLEEFSLYTTRLYVKEYEFTESELLNIFNLKILPILEKFIIDKESAVKDVLENAHEPYLFLAACLEYAKYKEYLAKGMIYKTGFYIMLDCSGSGAQIISLLLLLEDFSKYLNLTNIDRRQDFYVYIAKNFFLENSRENHWLIPDALGNKEFISEIRSICKRPTMTQLYGVSYRKYSDDLRTGFKNSQPILVKYIKIDYDLFIDEFIKLFWIYLRDLKLFKFRDFFMKIINELRKVNKPLSWSVLNSSKITVDYRIPKKKVLDFTDAEVGRKQIKILKGTENICYSKQLSSAQANFIHSFDAFVSEFILASFEGSIFPNHDSWGVNMGHTKSLQKHVQDGYLILSKDNAVLKTIITNFIQLLQESVGEKAAKSFYQYCANHLIIGNYDVLNLSNSKFLVYYGS